MQNSAPLAQATYTSDSFVNFEALEQQIKTYHDRFNAGKPFRYLVIDNFLHEEIALTLAEQFPDKTNNWIDASGKSTRNKWTSPIIEDSIAAKFFKEVQSERFTRWLEAVTGIQGFIHDEEYFGAGFHQTGDGGFLNVHIDFNKLPNGMDRRLNLLVYMNKEWHEDWGGQLELWDMEKEYCIETVTPILNRAVIFETNEISYHGQPKPVQTAGAATRNSFSVYYYTEGRPEEEASAPHSTIYVNTEGSAGKRKLFFNTLEQIITLKPLRRRIAERQKNKQ